MTLSGTVQPAASIIVSDPALHAWQDRLRDPSLTVLLVVQLCLVFLAAPLAAKRLLIARPIIQTMLSHRGAAIVVILPGLGS
jgi:hypothetical protein